MGLMLIQMLLAAIRVQRLLHSQNIHFTMARCFLFNCTGLFYSLFLPGGISGDAVRAFYFMQSGEDSRLRILGALFLDRLLGLISMVGLGLVAAVVLALSMPLIRPYIMVFITIFAFLLGMLLLLQFLGRLHVPGDHGDAWFDRLWARIKRMIADLHLTRYPAQVVMTAIALSLLIQASAVVLIFYCAEYARSGLGILEVSAVAPIGLLINAIPISPGGLGVGEKGFEILFKGLGGENGANAFLTSRVFLYSPAALGAVYGLKRLFLYRKKRITAEVANGGTF